MVKKSIVYLLTIIALSAVTLQQDPCPTGEARTGAFGSGPCKPCPSGCETCEYNFFADNDQSCTKCKSGYDLEVEGFAAKCIAQTNIGLIVGLVAGGIVLVIIIIVICCCIQRRRRGVFQNQMAMNNPNNVMGGGMGAPKPAPMYGAPAPAPQQNFNQGFQPVRY